MVLRMQFSPVSGDPLDIAVDRIDQWPRMAERAAPITPQRVVASRPYGPITSEVLANAALIAVVETEGSHARSVGTARVQNVGRRQPLLERLCAPRG